MLNWLRNLFPTERRALDELQRLRPEAVWRIVHTEGGTVKVYRDKMLVTHRESLALCMSRIRKYQKTGLTTSQKGKGK
jgi:hypothetical protein